MQYDEKLIKYYIIYQIPQFFSKGLFSNGYRCPEGIIDDIGEIVLNNNKEVLQKFSRKNSKITTMKKQLRM